MRIIASTALAFLLIATAGFAHAKPPKTHKTPSFPAAPALDTDAITSVVALKHDGNVVAIGIVTTGGKVITTARVALTAVNTRLTAGDTDKAVRSLAIDAANDVALVQMHGVIPPMAQLAKPGTAILPRDGVVCVTSDGNAVASVGQVRHLLADALAAGRDADAWKGATTDSGACGIFDARTKLLKGLLMTRITADLQMLSRIVPIKAIHALMEER
jgi:hypothetical protein